MSELDTDSYTNHRDTTIGDFVYAKDTDGNEYYGSVMQVKGSTVYVQEIPEDEDDVVVTEQSERKMYEFRRFKDNGTPIIVLGIDGKNEYIEHEPEHGFNKDGVPITKESTTMSFDYQIVSFDVEESDLVLG